MAIHGYKGGVVSATAPTVSPSSASGVWTLEDQLQNSANWPVTNTLLNDSTRLRSSATAYMGRTPATAGNRKTWTFSAWIKRGTLSTDQTLFHCYDGSSSRRSTIQFNSDNTIGWDQGGSSTSGLIDTVAVFRDPSAWYHLVCVANYSNGTAANRALIYINNVLQTVTTTDDFDNADGLINSTYAHQIASEGGTSNFFDGYLADINFIDGQALTPNYFGATNPNTGVWQPAQYHGTYGTNGFYLPMNIEQLQASFTRSLRFRSSASAYLSRTPASAGNQQRWTFSTWVKRGALGATQVLFGQGTGTGANGYGFFRFDSTDILQISCSPNGATSSIVWSSTPVYRDPSAWYHVVAVLDTTQATAANRFVLYVNGVAQSGSFSTTPTQNANIEINRAAAHQIGCANAVSLNNFLDGYQTEINFIDGLALAPNLFGTTDATSGAWVPVTYSGSYGTNGFFLPFTNATSTTTLGYDFSGLGNNWTTNNISVTAGTTYDSMTDVPTLTSATASNFAVMNPIDSAASTLPQYANLRLTNSNSTHSITRGTLGVTSGKWYWEITVSSAMSNFYSGVATNQTNISTTTTVGADAYSWAYVGSNGEKRYNGSTASYGAALVNGDVLGCALDLDNGKIYWSVNGTFQGSGDPVAGTNPAFTGVTGTCFPAGGTYNMTIDYNFGQRPFSYTPPTGYVALNTYNM